MKLSIMFASLVIVAMIGGASHAQGWDRRGWVKLGEREVNGRVDRDRIEVGRREGKFAKLTMFVENSDLELLDFEVVFGSGERFHPEVHHFFREGQRERVIDLPGDDRVIKSINLKYRNLPGGGRAHVEVWGWKAGSPPPAPPPPPPPPPRPFSWDNAGWVLLGEREVNGRVDHDRIEVGRREGKFSRLTVVVTDSDLEMIDFEIKFARGPAFHPAVSHYFREGQRTRVIEFPGDERIVKFIDFRYRNLPGGGRARVQVWAK